jgi:hypothetical protein
LDDLNAKVGREDIFKPTIRNESSHEITNDNVVKSSKLSSSSLARQTYVGPGIPQKLLSAEVSGYCFFRFRDKSLFQGRVVSPTPNPRLSWRADVFCQGCLL